MRVVHLAHNYGLNNTGGAAIAATRIHQALLSAGVDSHYVCVNQKESGTNVYEIPQRGSGWWLLRRMLRFGEHIISKIICGHGRSNGFEVVPLFGLERVLAEIKPDIVQIHRTNGEVAPFQQLARLPYRVIFHLHDIYPFNALRAYPGDDRRYVEGFTRHNSCFAERRIFVAKQRAIARLKPTFIGPSAWICRCCQSSMIAKGCRVATIPYLFDRRFDYCAKFRKLHSKFIALFGCFVGRGNGFKGWRDVRAALELLPQDYGQKMEVHVFGENGSDEVVNGIRVHVLGNFSSPEDLVQVYNSADAFLLASKEDNSPLTKFEALYCGLPVLAFDRTGCAEYIDHMVNGWVAKDGDLVGYSEGIRFWQRKFQASDIPYEEISKRAREKFAPAQIVEAMARVYEEVLEK